MKAKYIIIVAVTIDGKIATGKKHYTDWSSKEDKKFLRAFLNSCDVIVVGNNTYKTASKPLSKRNCIVFSRSQKVRKSESQGGLVYINPQKKSVARMITAKRYKKVCILGGTQTYNYFLNKDMIDEMFIVIEPIVFGDGLGLFSTLQKEYKRYKLVSIKKLNTEGSILLHYVK